MGLVHRVGGVTVTDDLLAVGLLDPELEGVELGDVSVAMGSCCWGGVEDAAGVGGAGAGAGVGGATVGEVAESACMPGTFFFRFTLMSCFRVFRRPLPQTPVR